MKTLLAIGVLFIYVHQIASEQLVAECKYDEKWKKQELDRINRSRKKIAEKHNISNMHEIVSYNFELDKEVQKMKTCADVKHGSNYRLNNHTDGVSIKLIGHLFQKDTHGEYDHNMEFIEEFHPLQTSFAICMIHPFCKMKKPDVPNIRRFGGGDGVNIEIQNIHVFGPKGTFSASDIKYGPPGSDCPLGKAESGLCKSPEVKHPISNEEAPSEESSKASASSYSPLFYLPIFLMILLE